MVEIAAKTAQSDQKQLAGHAWCHRSRTVYLLLHLNLSRATHGAIDRAHGQHRTDTPPRSPETAKPGTPHYRDSPSGTVYVDVFHVNRQKRAQNLSQWPRTEPSIAGHARCHRSRFQDSLDRGSRTLTLSSPLIIIIIIISSSSSSSSRRRRRRSSSSISRLYGVALS